MTGFLDSGGRMRTYRTHNHMDTRGLPCYIPYFFSGVRVQNLRSTHCTPRSARVPPLALHELRFTRYAPQVAPTRCAPGAAAAGGLPAAGCPRRAGLPTGGQRHGRNAGFGMGGCDGGVGAGELDRDAPQITPRTGTARCRHWPSTTLEQHLRQTALERHLRATAERRHV